MAIDFPSAPATNDEFTAGDRVWVYDGTVWNAKGLLSVSQSQVTGLDATLAGIDDLLSEKASLVGAETLTNKTLSSAVLEGAAREAVYTTSTGFAGYTFDLTTNCSVQYSTSNATSNGTVNFRSTSSQSVNTLMSVGQSITAVLMVTNGSTAYYANAFQVDGTSVTPKWSGGTAPTSGNASSIDVYTFTIIKTASATFTVLAAISKFA